MDHITIPIPDGLDATQKAELTHWLTEEAATYPERFDFEDDPAYQAATSAANKRAMQDVQAGRVLSSAELTQRLDAKIGHDRTE